MNPKVEFTVVMHIHTKSCKHGEELLAIQQRLGLSFVLFNHTWSHVGHSVLYVTILLSMLASHHIRHQPQHGTHYLSGYPFMIPCIKNEPSFMDIVFTVFAVVIAHFFRFQAKSIE